MIPANPAEASTAVFESLRGRLFGLAYRMLGSRGDAEDVVQEAYLRWHQADRNRIDSAEAWLVTTTSRLAIDRLRRLKTEREAYSGRYSGLRILLLLAPSHPLADPGQWIQQVSSPITAAWPFPILTGFPF